VPLPNRALTDADAAAMRSAYEKEYAQLFERFIPNAVIEVLSWSVTVSTEATQPAAVTDPSSADGPKPIGSRAFYDARLSRRVDVPVYWRGDLKPGGVVPGPAIIAEDETSTFVSAIFDAWLDNAGGITLERRSA
jgi:N-methylhydantoinase A